MNKNKRWISLSFIIFAVLLILIGTYKCITTQEKQTEVKNNRLNEITQAFNKKNVKSYYEGKNVEVRAKTSSSTLTLYYVLNEKEISYNFELKENILESRQLVDEVIITSLLDTILNLKKESAYSFLSVVNNHTILDYSLEEDGIEFTKEASMYKVKVNLDKELNVKEVFDTVITSKDIKEEVLKINDNNNIYYQKGYVIYKEEIDSRGNTVVTFAQSKYCNIENLRQSIASYLELAKGKDTKDKFLSEVSNDALEQQSYTRDNYELSNSYVVFKEELQDECFDYYLSNNYRVVTLIIDTK